jgi:hypothetical protein
MGSSFALQEQEYLKLHLQIQVIRCISMENELKIGIHPYIYIYTFSRKSAHR